MRQAGQRSAGARRVEGQIDYGPDSHVFTREVEMMKERYSALAQFLIHLLGEKRGEGPSGAVAAPVPVAAASAPPAAPAAAVSAPPPAAAVSSVTELD